MKESAGGLGLGILLLLGIFGVGAVAVAIVLSRHNISSGHQPSEIPQAMLIEPSVSFLEAVPVQPSNVVLENEQTVKLVRGPDGLLEEIIIHRKVIQHGR